MATHFLSILVRFAFLPLITTIAVAVPAPAFQLPLFTNSSHITDTTGARVKLTCVSWAGHLEANIPEGLHHNSLSSIAFLIKSSGFNCVRLTSSTWLWTRSNSSLTTVFHHFQSLNLSSAIAGLQLYNPHLLHQPLRSVHESVVATLASHDLMVILDNHVSKPQWCCGDSDGNGFWGDEYFNPEEWLQGLVTVAIRFRTVPHVVGMSLRNELRGKKQNRGDWERYITQATSAVHGVNPKVLIIAGGLNYASDFSFGGKSDHGGEDHELVVALAPGKVVYEFHWYKWFARGSDFDDAKDGEACARVVEGEVRGRSHSQQKVKVPYFLSEFGVKQEGELSYGDGRFLKCVIEYLKEEQEAWALWALQGSYYLRNGMQDFEETFGVLDAEWHSIRNPELIARLRPIQESA